jgi:hypothetical protein
VVVVSVVEVTQEVAVVTFIIAAAVVILISSSAAVITLVHAINDGELCQAIAESPSVEYNSPYNVTYFESQHGNYKYALRCFLVPCAFAAACIMPHNLTRYSCSNG